MDKSWVSGAYAFWCPNEGRCYVGGSMNVNGRRRCHISRLRAGRHSNKLFQAAFDLHGESSLEFVVLEECPPLSLSAVEKWWVVELGRQDLLFWPTSAGLTSGAPGVSRSTSTKLKISESLLGRRKSLEHRQNLWANRKGWRHSQESKVKISIGLLKAAESGNRSGPPDGWKHSDESKAKMLGRGKGVPKSPEHRAKIAAAVKAARRRKRWSSKRS